MSAPGSKAVAAHYLPELSSKRWWVLMVASIGVFLAALDATILAVALPAISEDLVLTYSEALWVQAAYLLVVTVLLIPIGRWSEKRGPYFFYWLGTLLFGVFSVMVALSPNGVFMIVGRVFQGVGGAMILTTSAAIVAAVFPPRERGRALALNMLGSTVGQTFGPPLGGLIVTHMGWPWVFLIKVPVVAITLIAGWSLLGAERRDRGAAGSMDAARSADAARKTAAARGGVDLPGAALLGMLLSALFVPLIFSPLWGWDNWAVIGPLASVVVLAAVFIYIENRTREPILDLGLFKRSRVLTTMTAASILYMSAAYGVPILTAVFLVVVQGRSAQTAGFILLIHPALLTILTPIAGYLSDRFGSRGLTALGMLVTAAGMVQLGVFTPATPTWQILTAMTTLGLGIALFSTPNFSAIMGAVDRSELGVASGMFATSRFCGMGISIAVLGAIAASKLGPDGGRVILLGARAGVENAQAFAAGYREAMLVGAGFTVVGAFVSLVRERRPRPGSETAALPRK